MKISSSYWNEKDDVCTKHWIVGMPCMSCLATDDPDVEYRLTEIEKLELELNPEMKATDFLPVIVLYARQEKEKNDQLILDK